MRKTRVGVALLAVALLLELFANLTGTTPGRSAPPAERENQIQRRENNNDNDQENQARAQEQARWRELARALRTVPSATEKHGNSGTVGAVAPAVASGERALRSVYDPDWARGKFAHFSREEWAAMAERCELRWQAPPFSAAAPSENGPEYDRALAAAQAKYRAALTGLYREAGGADADALGLRTLEDAVRGLDVSDATAVHRRLAEERAGHVTTADGSIYERFLRLQLATGDEFEAALAEAVGADQARAWREAAGPKLTLSGCDREHAVFRGTR
jgi:hypothetical protein